MGGKSTTFIIGDREFVCVRMNAFAAHTLLQRILKYVAPLAGHIKGDADVMEAAAAIAGALDEDIMQKLVLPMFSESRVALSESPHKVINSPAMIDITFTPESLMDIYVLAYECARYQLGDFFASAVAKFGSLSAQPNK